MLHFNACLMSNFRRLIDTKSISSMTFTGYLSYADRCSTQFKMIVKRIKHIYSVKFLGKISRCCTGSIVSNVFIWVPINDKVHISCL